MTGRPPEEASLEGSLESLDLELDVDLYGSIVADMEQHSGFHAPAEVWSPESLFPDSEETRERPSFADLLAPWVGSYTREATPEEAGEMQEFVAGLGPRVLLPASVRKALEPDARPRVVDLRTAHDIALMTSHMRTGEADRPRILEVGAGYGRLAEAFMSLPNGATYVIVDAVPGSLYYAHAYLKAVLPDHTIGSWYVDGAERVGEFDCFVVPTWHVEDVALEPFDLAVNIASFQEMTEEQVAFYLQLFDRLVDRGGAIYISNSRDYKYPRDYTYPANWKAVFKANTPFAVTMHYPVEIFERTDGDWALHNALTDRQYLLSLYATAREEVDAAKKVRWKALRFDELAEERRASPPKKGAEKAPPKAPAEKASSKRVEQKTDPVQSRPPVAANGAGQKMSETKPTTVLSYADALAIIEQLDPEIQPYNSRAVPGRMRQFAEFLEQAGGTTLAGKRVADFGAGNGTPLLWMCLEAGATGGVAVETNESRLSFMRKLFHAVGLDEISVVSANLNDYSPEPGLADVVSIVDVFAARGVDIRRTFESAFTILTPGGTMVVKSANWIYKPGGISRHAPSQVMPLQPAETAELYYSGVPPHHDMHSVSAASALVREAGFEDVRFTWALGPAWQLPDMPARARPCLSFWFLAARKPGTPPPIEQKEVELWR